MNEDGRHCTDVLGHPSAARGGLESAALRILEDHVNGCLRAIERCLKEESASDMLAAVRRLRSA
jgi:DNA-binding FrmR family transcriptional regulator